MVKVNRPENLPIKAVIPDKRHTSGIVHTRLKPVRRESLIAACQTWSPVLLQPPKPADEVWKARTVADVRPIRAAGLVLCARELLLHDIVRQSSLMGVCSRLILLAALLDSEQACLFGPKGRAGQTRLMMPKKTPNVLGLNLTPCLLDNVNIYTCRKRAGCMTSRLLLLPSSLLYTHS